MRGRVLQPVSRGATRRAPSPVAPPSHVPRQADSPMSAYLPRPSLLHGHEAVETYGIDSRLFAATGSRPPSALARGGPDAVARTHAANRLAQHAAAHAPPALVRHDPALAAPVAVQRWPKSIPGWARRTLTGAAGLIGGAAGYLLTPGTMTQRAVAATTTGLAGAALAHRALPPATPTTRPVVAGAAATFSEQLRGQRDFHRDIDQRLNHHATFAPDKEYPEEESALNVPSGNVTDVAKRLRDRETEQRRLIGPVNEAGGDIFDDTIDHHEEKNQLWRDWTARAAAGTTQNTPTGVLGRAWNNVSSRLSGSRPDSVDQDFRDRTATTLARVIGTESGHKLMDHVHRQAKDLGIPIHFVEEKAGAAFNMSVSPGMNEDQTALQHLTVTVPAAGEYDDAQSFKRAHGGDVTRTGETLTAAPLDTDLFHEFVHAAHYLAMERRRRTAAESGDRPTFTDDYQAYQHSIGGKQSVLGEQDKVSEASTIHRSPSLNDLRGLLEHNAREASGDEHKSRDAEQDHARHNASASSAAAVKHIDQLARDAAIPAENTYRDEIGLQPRQDHRALSLTKDGEYEYGGYGHRIVLT